jgi:DNA-binding response OmpR family regulator
MNLDTYSVQVSGVPVDLTFHEFELLRLLGQSADRVINYDQLCEEIWHGSGSRLRPRLNVVVCRLRNKLAASFPYHLETVRRRGYGLLKSAAGAYGGPTVAPSNPSAASV